MNLAAKPAHYDGLRKTHEVLAERLGYETQHGAQERDALGDRPATTTTVRWSTPRVPACTSASSPGASAESAASARRADPREGVGRAGRSPGWHPARGGHVAGQRRRPTRCWSPPAATPAGRSAGMQLRIAPVGSFIIVTEPLGKEVCDQLMPNRRMASDTKNLLYYFRITPDHRLLFGGRARFAMSEPAVGREERPDPAEGDGLGLPAARQDPGRLLLGRPGRHEHGPHGPRRRARRALLLPRLLRARRADGDVHGQADGRVHERSCRTPTPGATSPSSGSPATSARRGSCRSPAPTTSSWTSSSSPRPVTDPDHPRRQPMLTFLMRRAADPAGDAAGGLGAGVPDPVCGGGRPGPEDPAGPAERPGAGPGPGRGADQGAGSGPADLRAVLRLAAARC